MGKVVEVLCDLGHPPQGQCCDGLQEFGSPQGPGRICCPLQPPLRWGRGRMLLFSRVGFFWVATVIPCPSVNLYTTVHLDKEFASLILAVIKKVFLTNSTSPGTHSSCRVHLTVGSKVPTSVSSCWVEFFACFKHFQRGK